MSGLLLSVHWCPLIMQKKKLKTNNDTLLPPFDHIQKYTSYYTVMEKYGNNLFYHLYKSRPTAQHPKSSDKKTLQY